MKAIMRISLLGFAAGATFVVWGPETPAMFVALAVAWSAALLMGLL